MHTYCHSTENKGRSQPPEHPMVFMPMDFHKQAAMNLFSKQVYDAKGFCVVLSTATAPILQVNKTFTRIVSGS